ncbi:pectin esterase, partial [bacterium]|nr:pectin esterase [bacterium]
MLYNKNTLEGISQTATINFTNTANNVYMQDITLRNKDFRNGTSMGRCVVLQDQGTKNIYKNVNLQSNQDTYYSGSGRLYFENSALHGTVDYLCGGGDVFFNECL